MPPVHVDGDLDDQGHLGQASAGLYDEQGRKDLKIGQVAATSDGIVGNRDGHRLVIGAGGHLQHQAIERITQSVHHERPTAGLDLLGEPGHQRIEREGEVRAASGPLSGSVSGRCLATGGQHNREEQRNDSERTQSTMVDLQTSPPTMGIRTSPVRQALLAP